MSGENLGRNDWRNVREKCPDRPAPNRPSITLTDHNDAYTDPCLNETISEVGWNRKISIDSKNTVAIQVLELDLELELELELYDLRL